MQTSVYIANSEIRAVTGKDRGHSLKMKGCYAQPLPEGLLQNGAIADFTGLAQTVSVFFAQNRLPRRQVNLVLDCDSALTKIMEAPLLPAKKLRQLVKGEYIGQGEAELLCDYAVLEPAIKPAGARILACALEKQIVGQYLDLCNRIGVELVQIDLALSCAIRYCRRIPALTNRTYIMTILSGADIVSLLFVDGFYRFSNRSRLFEQRGTPAAAVEISRTLSSLVQFNAAQKNEQAITNAYICGMQGDEVEFCNDISSLLNIEVSITPEWKAIKRGVQVPMQTRAGDFIYCLGDIMCR